MADFAFSDVASKVTTPQQMTIGDMVNMARGVQELKKAQEINPLLIEEARQKVKGSTAEANVSEQTQGSRISKADTEAKSALVGLSSAQVDNLKKHSTLVTQGIQSLMSKPDLTSDDIVKAATELNINAGGDEKSLKNSLQGMPTGKDGKPAHPLELKSFLAKKLASTLDSAAQIDKLYPTPVTQNLGNKVVPVNTGNQMLTGNVPGSVAGQSHNMGLTPQLAPTIEGGLTVVGGGAGNGGVKNNTTSQSNPNAQQNAGNNLQPPPGMTKESYLATLNAPINNFRDAISRQNDKTNPNYIPDRMFNNKNVMGLLKDSEVDTQKIASYLSDPLKYKLLNPKEQELAKLMEQRVQGMKPGSVADLHSVQTALGTPNLSKETLMDLMRNEAGQLVTEDLLTRGRKNAGGNPNNPNAQAINNFDSAFQRYSSNPLLMKYIGIIGEGKGGWLDKTDNQALQKIYDKLPRDKNGSHVSAARQLEFERQGLLKLVNGGQ